MQSKGEIKSLTGIRGIAACYVVVYHYLVAGSGEGLAGSVIRHGYLAVDLFFVLSGYVMALTYSREFEAKFTGENYAHFLTRRLARVYPLYAVVTLACLLLYYADRHTQGLLPKPSWLSVGSNLFLVQEWGLAESIDGPGWSISAELFAYILFPWLVSVMLFGSARLATVVTALGVIGLCALEAVPDATARETVRFGPLDLYKWQTVFPLVRCVIEFCLGLLTWRLAAVPWIRSLAGRGDVSNGIVVAILLLLVIPNTDVILVLLFGPLILTLSVGRSLSTRVMEARPIHWLGVLSYSIYLIHEPIIVHFKPPAVRILETWHIPHPHLVSAVVLIPCTVLISVATFRMIEKPGRRLVQGLWLQRRDPLPAPVSGPRN